MGLSIDFCGEITEADGDGILTIGRDADVDIDDNPFLHRNFLTVSRQSGVWILSNVGSQLSATVSESNGRLEAFLSPGAAIPLIFAHTSVAFTAGPTSYEVIIRNDEPTFSQVAAPTTGRVGDTTVGPTRLTPDQLLLILSLAEPRLRGDGRAATSLPTSSEAAKRLGWTQSKFNRKLDNVCQKLTKAGVRGLYGATGEMASARRARLVEYAVATRLVHRGHLQTLEARAELAKSVAETA